VGRGWYESIAGSSYYFSHSAQSNVAFFPLYPLLVKLVSFVKYRFLMPGWLSPYFVFGEPYLLGTLLPFVDLGEKSAKITLLLLAFSPFSFFFAMGYSEALFLLLLALTLLFTDKKKWWLAAIAAGLASSTRFIGVFYRSS